MDGYNEENVRLIEVAKTAMQNAYAPYSKFKVGAALLADDGRIFKGCNIENASYGATVCAERTAIFSAVSQNVTHFKKLAVVSANKVPTYPCGICRQVMCEFMDEDAVILLEKGDDIIELKLSELLPYGFTSDFLQ